MDVITEFGLDDIAPLVLFTLHPLSTSPETAETEIAEKFADASPIDRINADAPPFVIAQGDKDTLAPVEEARAFVEQLAATASSPVVYFEFPGAQHIFDLGVRDVTFNMNYEGDWEDDFVVIQPGQQVMMTYDGGVIDCGKPGGQE